MSILLDLFIFKFNLFKQKPSSKDNNDINWNYQHGPIRVWRDTSGFRAKRLLLFSEPRRCVGVTSHRQFHFSDDLSTWEKINTVDFRSYIRLRVIRLVTSLVCVQVLNRVIVEPFKKGKDKSNHCRFRHDQSGKNDNSKGGKTTRQTLGMKPSLGNGYKK